MNGEFEKIIDNVSMRESKERKETIVNERRFLPQSFELIHLSNLSIQPKSMLVIEYYSNEK